MSDFDLHDDTPQGIDPEDLMGDPIAIEFADREADRYERSLSYDEEYER